MITSRQIEIENRPYSFNDMINIKNFGSNLLDIGKYHLKVPMLLFTILYILQ